MTTFRFVFDDLISKFLIGLDEIGISMGISDESVVPVFLFMA